MSEDIRFSVGADTTPMESQIKEASRRVGTITLNVNADSKGLDSLSRPLGRLTGQADEFTKSMEAANARVLAFGASVGVINGISAAFKNLISSTLEVEQSLAEISATGGKTFSDLQKVSTGIFDIAKRTGLSFKDAAEATLEFSRQGKNLSESLQSAQAALVLTRTTGMDAAEAVKGLTAAVNAFNEPGLNMVSIVNKLAAVDSAFAVSSKDLIEGISRSASVAQEAGVSFNELTALITTLQEKTGRGGAVIGNAIKTIFTRVQNPEILKDIKDLGIAVENAADGSFLPAINILQNLANNFDKLDGNLRKSLLLKVGGGFQIDKLAAILNDLKDANGTFQGSLATGAGATFEAYDRLEKINKTVAGSFQNLLSTSKELGSNIGRIGFSEDFIKVLEKGSSLLQGLNESIFGNGEEQGKGIGTALLKGIGSVVSGPGLAIFLAIIAKLGYDFLKFGATALQTQLGISTKAKEEEQIRKSILTVLDSDSKIREKLNQLDGDSISQAKVLLGVYQQQVEQIEKRKNLTEKLAPLLREAGVVVDSGGTTKAAKGAIGAADGYVPNLAQAISNEKQQAPKGSKILIDHNFPMGGGQTGTMVYNSNETRIKNFGGSGGDAIIPNYPVSAAKGYTPNFARKAATATETEEERNRRLALPGLGISAKALSVAGITLAGEATNIDKTKGYPLSYAKIKKFEDSPLFPELQKYSSFFLTDLPVGNAYRFRKKLIEKEDVIKSDFVSRANQIIKPSMIQFFQQEIDSLGLKPGKGLGSSLSNLKFTLVDPSLAGRLLEEILKAPALTDAERFIQYKNQSNTSLFDILNLDPDIAEAYGLPRGAYHYTDIKLGERELRDTMSEKALNQMVYELGGSSYSRKIKNSAKGFIPNFADEVFSISRAMSELGKIDSKEKADPYDIFNGKIKLIRQQYSNKEYYERANDIVSSIYPKKGLDKLEFDENMLIGYKSFFEREKANPTYIKTWETTLRNKDAGYGEYISSTKGMLGELDAKELINKQLVGGNNPFDFANYIDARTRKEDSAENLLKKGVNFWLRNKNYAENGIDDNVNIPKMTAIVASDTNFKNAAKGYVPNFAKTESSESTSIEQKTKQELKRDLLKKSIEEGNNFEKNFYDLLRVNMEDRPGYGAPLDLPKGILDKVKNKEKFGIATGIPFKTLWGDIKLSNNKDNELSLISKYFRYTKLPIDGSKQINASLEHFSMLYRNGPEDSILNKKASLPALVSKNPSLYAQISDSLKYKNKNELNKKGRSTIIDFTYNSDKVNAAKGYVPNFANTSETKGGFIRYRPLYARVPLSRAISSFDEQSGTTLQNTDVGDYDIINDRPKLNENNIIASILGNNTFFQKDSSQKQVEDNLLSFVRILTAQGQLTNFKSGAYTMGGLATGVYNVKKDQVISGELSGKFKNLDYTKLDKIFPRLWRAKGVGKEWQIVKDVAAGMASPIGATYRFPPEVRENIDKYRDPSPLTNILRNVAISSVRDYDKDLLGFNIDISKSEDQQYLNRKGIRGDTSYLSLFSSKGFSKVENTGLREARRLNIYNSLPLDIKNAAMKKGTTSYGSFSKWYDQNSSNFGLATKKQAQEELAQILNLQSIQYDPKTKQMVFVGKSMPSSAAKGFIPNFAYDLGVNKNNIAIRSVTAPFDEQGNRIRGSGAVKEAILAAIQKAKSKGFNKIYANIISDSSLNAFTKYFGSAVKGKNVWNISDFKNAAKGFIPNFNQIVTSNMPHDEDDEETEYFPHSFIAKHGNNTVGTLETRLLHKDKGVYVEGIEVDEDYRNQGIAKALYTRLKRSLEPGDKVIGDIIPQHMDEWDDWGENNLDDEQNEKLKRIRTIEGLKMIYPQLSRINLSRDKAFKLSSDRPGYGEYEITEKTPKTDPIYKALIKRAKYASDARLQLTTYAAKGFIPNFSNPIYDAVKREQSQSGLSLSQISVTRDSRLANSLNPSGFAVINKRDEPNGIVPSDRISSAYKNAGRGFIPNFVDAPLGAAGSVLVGGGNVTAAEAAAVAAQGRAANAREVKATNENITSTTELTKQETNLTEIIKKIIKERFKEKVNEENLNKVLVENIEKLNKKELKKAIAEGNIVTGLRQRDANDIIREARQIQTSQVIDPQATATVPNTPQNNPPQKPEEDKNKEDKPKQEQSLQQTLGKLAVFQAGLSFATGALSSLGEAGQKVGSIINDLGQGLYLVNQSKDLVKSIIGEKQQANLQNLGIKDIGSFGSSTELFKKLTSSATRKETFAAIRGESGAIVGGLRSAALIAGPYVAAGLIIAKGASMINDAVKAFGQTADITASSLGKLTDIQKTYTLNLTEEERSKASGFTKRVGNVEAATEYDKFFESITQTFSSKTGSKTRESLINLGLEGSVNTGIVSQLSASLIPETQKQFQSQTGPTKLKFSDIQDKLISEKIDEISKASTKKVTITREDAYQQIDELNKDKTINLKEKMQISNAIIESIGTSIDKLDLDKFFENLQKELRESSRTNAKQGVTKKLIEESFLLPLDVLKSQINTIGELAKVYGQLTTAAENKLAVEKELLSTDQFQKSNLDAELRLKQSQKQYENEVRGGAFTFAQGVSDKIISYMGTGVTPGYSDIIKEDFKNLKQNLYNPQKSTQENLTDLKSFIEKIKTNGLENQGGTEEEIKKRKETVEALTIEVEKFNEMQKIMKAQLDSRNYQIKLENLNTAIIQQQNFFYNKRKDLILSEVNILQKAIALEEKKASLRNQASDLGFQRSISLTPTVQRENITALRDALTQNQRDTESRSFEDRKANLTDLQTAQNFILQRLQGNTAIEQLNKLPKNGGTVDLKEVFKNVLELENKGLSDRVTESAKQFSSTIVNASEEVKKNFYKIIQAMPMTSEQRSETNKQIYGENFYPFSINSVGTNTPKLNIPNTNNLSFNKEDYLNANKNNITDVTKNSDLAAKLGESQAAPKSSETAKEQDALNKQRIESAISAIVRNRINYTLEKETQIAQAKIAAEQKANELSKQRLEEEIKIRDLRFQTSNQDLKMSDLEKQRAQLAYTASTVGPDATRREQKEKAAIDIANREKVLSAMTSLRDKISPKEYQDMINNSSGKNVDELVGLYTDNLNKAQGNVFSNPSSDLVKLSDAALDGSKALSIFTDSIIQATKQNSQSSPDINQSQPLDNDKQKAIEDLQNRINNNLKTLAPGFQENQKETSKEDAKKLLNLDTYVSKKGSSDEEVLLRKKELENFDVSNYTFSGGVQKSLNTMRENVSTFKSKLGEEIPNAFKDGLVGAMKGAMDMTKPFKQSMLEVANAFLGRINDKIMGNLADKVTGSLFSPLGLASGGPITGGSGNKDDVPAMLMGGEYVINKSAVSKYGPTFFDALNSGKIKKFASGGWVESDVTKYQDPNSTVPYGQKRDQGLSFDEKGSVIGMDSYTGSQENKADALKRAQSDYYARNAQNGQGGFYMPGQNGMGAIMGQRNLLAFATQQTTGTQFDKTSGSGGSASIDIGAGSSNLSLFALRDQGNIRNQEYQKSKEQAKDLYFGGVEAAKEKANKEEEIRQEQERLKQEARTKERQMYQGIIRQMATTAAMAGISALGSAALSGGSNAIKAANAQAMQSGGAELSGMDKFKTFAGGMWSGGTLNGETAGGLSNAFNSSGYKSFQGFASGKNTYLFKGNSVVSPTEKYGWQQQYSKPGGYWSSNSVYMRAAGGYVPGNGMGDNVPTMLNGGEFVMSKQAAQNIGMNKLQQMNSTGKSQGGDSDAIVAKLDELVEKLSAVGSVNITVNSDSSKSSEKSNDSNSNEQTKELARKIKEVVLNVLRDEKRLGGMLR